MSNDNDNFAQARDETTARADAILADAVRRARLVQINECGCGAATWVIDECRDALRAWLSAGPISEAIVHQLAAARGFEPTLLEHAAEQLAVTTRKGFWRLP